MAHFLSAFRLRLSCQPIPQRVCQITLLWTSSDQFNLLVTSWTHLNYKLLANKRNGKVLSFCLLLCACYQVLLFKYMSSPWVAWNMILSTSLLTLKKYGRIKETTSSFYFSNPSHRISFLCTTKKVGRKAASEIPGLIKLTRFVVSRNLWIYI